MLLKLLSPLFLYFEGLFSSSRGCTVKHFTVVICTRIYLDRNQLTSKKGSVIPKKKM
jgi:hypothetical protein